MQLTPTVTIQLDDVERSYISGDVVSGTIFITSRNPTMIQQASVHIKAKVAYLDDDDSSNSSNSSTRKDAILSKNDLHRQASDCNKEASELTRQARELTRQAGKVTEQANISPSSEQVPIVKGLKAEGFVLGKFDDKHCRNSLLAAADSLNRKADELNRQAHELNRRAESLSRQANGPSGQDRQSEEQHSTSEGTKTWGIRGPGFVIGVSQDAARPSHLQLDQCPPDYRPAEQTAAMTTMKVSTSEKPFRKKHVGEGDRQTITILKTQDVNVTDAPQWIEAGMTALKFSIKLSSSASGQDLVPTIESFNGVLETFYELVVSIRVPAPFLSFVPLPVKAKRRITVKNHTSSENLHPNSSSDGTRGPSATMEARDQAPLRNAGSAETRVGYWDTSSRSLLRLVDYYLGVDTAESWTDIRVETLVVPTITASNATASSDLQGKLKVLLTLPNSEEAYVVNLERCGEKFGDDEKLPSWDAVKASPQIRVSSVKLDLLSSILVAGFSNKHRALWLEKPLMEPLYVGYGTVLGHGTTDISLLFQSARLPPNLPPTVTHTDLTVMHWLKVSVELESITVDGTGQVPSLVDIKVPITVQ